MRPVSHTRAGGEEKGSAKAFHTKGNKQVHLLATNQFEGFCANINKKGEKNKQARDLLRSLTSVEETQTHASNTGTCTHADEGTPVSSGGRDKMMGKYDIRLYMEYKITCTRLMTSSHKPVCT